MALETFGERVRFIRTLWGMTQSDIQRAGGPSRNTVSRWENNVDSPDESENSTLQSLAIALKCNLAWLLSGQGPIWPEGLVPPRGGDESGLSVLPKKGLLPKDPELGRYILNGPVDCAIMSRIIDILIEYTEYSFETFNYPEGIWLAYKYFSKQKDPLGPLEDGKLYDILSVVSDL